MASDAHRTQKYLTYRIPAIRNRLQETKARMLLTSLSKVHTFATKRQDIKSHTEPENVKLPTQIP